MSCILLWWASWRRSKLLQCGFLPAAFAPHQAFCTAKPCRRRNSLPPRIEIYARGPRKMLRHFVGSAKAAGRIAHRSGGPAGGGVSSSTQAKIKRWPQGHLFLQPWGNGSPRPRSALAMTGFFHELRCNSGRRGVVTPPPYGDKERGRAGRCGHRPLRNDDKKCCA